MQKSSNKTLIIAAVAVVAVLAVVGVILLIASGNNTPTATNGQDSTGNDTVSAEQQECYTQCEIWGGEVDICKAGCDASFDPNSVWNMDDEDVIDANDPEFSSWDNIPSVVPEFTYGTFVSGEEGFGSWIVDFSDVEDSAMANYAADLEAAGWNASYMELTNMLTGDMGEYSIMVNYDPDYMTAQIILTDLS